MFIELFPFVPNEEGTNCKLPVQVTLPSHFASYFVNNDSTGLSEDEFNIADDILTEFTAKGMHCHAITSEEEFIGEFGGLITYCSEFMFM